MPWRTSRSPSTWRCRFAPRTTSGPSSRSFRASWRASTSVAQLDDRQLRWQANVGGKDKEWTSEITEQRPDERVAWKSTSGAKNAGVVTFHRLADRKTRVMLQLEYDPEGMVENVGDAVGLVTGRVSRDLTRFKDYIESRQRETGAWRGEVPAKGL